MTPMSHTPAPKTRIPTVASITKAVTSAHATRTDTPTAS